MLLQNQTPYHAVMEPRLIFCTTVQKEQMTTRDKIDSEEQEQI